MNFQEAIELVLASSPKPMTAAEIADAINERKLFLDWKGKPVNAWLVNGRAAQYPKLFKLNGGLIKLNKDIPEQKDLLSQIRNILVHEKIADSEIIIPFLIFWARVTSNKTQLGYKYFGYFNFLEIDSKNVQTGNIQYIRNTIAYFNKKISADTNLRLKDFSQNIDFLQSYRYIHDTILNSGIIGGFFSDREFATLFNDLIQGLGLRFGNKGAGTTSESIKNIIHKILKDQTYKNIFDPFAGSAGIFCDSSITRNTNIVLQDNDKDIAMLSWFNMKLNGFTNFNINIGDSVMDIESINKTFDLIITEPPYTYKREKYARFNSLFIEYGPFNFESIYIQNILYKLKENGKAIIVIQDSLLYSNKYTFLRKYLIENDYVQMVISIQNPLNDRYFSIPTSIIVLNKDKESAKKNFIIFHDIYEIDLQISEIMSISSDWDSIPRYAEKISVNRVINDINYSLKTNKYISTIRKPFGETVKIKSLIHSVIRSNGEYDSKTIKKDFAVEPNSIPFISINDLRSTASNYILSTNKVERHLLLSDGLSVKGMVKEKSVLVSLVGDDLMPKLFEGGAPIVLSRNVLALIPDINKVIPEYLISQLNQEYVIDQIKRISNGGINKRIYIEDILNIEIRLESLDQQVKLLSEYYIDNYTKAELKLQEEQKKGEEQEIAILSSLKHELSGQVLQPLVQEIGLIKSYIDRKIDSKSTLSWEDGIANKIKSRKIKDVFSHIYDTISTATKLFENMQSIVELDKDSLQKEKVNLQKYIKSKVDSYGDILLGYHIVYSFELMGKSSVECEIDTDKFNNVISNFIRNSVQHGFDKETKDKYLVFNIDYNKSIGKVVLDMIDSGKGFAGDFNFNDYISFGVKTNSKGSGIGGYLLNRAVKVHGGSVEYFPIRKGELIFIPNMNGYPFVNKEQESNLSTKSIQPGVHLRIFLPAINYDKSNME